MGTKTQVSLGEKIRHGRLSLSKPLKQRELAAKIGVDPITVSRWERGVTRPSDLCRILLARVLGGHPNDYRDEDVAA